MIRRHHAVFRLSLMSADAFSAVATFIAVSMVRFGSGAWETAWRQAGIDPHLLMAIYAATWVGVIAVNDLYRLRARWSIRREALDVVRAGALLAVLTFSALFILKLPEVSRLFLLTLFPVQVVDTVGAGDAFGAGFLASWIAAGKGRADLGDLDAVRAATTVAIAVGAATAQRAGAEPPTLAELGIALA